MTQRSDTSEARTRGPSVSSQALYHWATALPEGIGQVATIPIIPEAKLFGCSRIIAHSLVRRFEQIRISMHRIDRRDVRKQSQDRTISLHWVSRIDVNYSSRQLLHTSTFHTRR